MSDLRYVIYGAGAVGGTIGGHLQRSGRPITLVARGEHLAKIRERGLLLDTEAGTHVIDAPATDTAADIDWTHPTVVIIAVKSQQTTAVLEDLVAHAPPGTIVAAAQNGVANETAILRRFHHTYAFNTDVSASYLEPGVVIQKWYPSPGFLDLGRFPSGTDEVAEAIAKDLRAALFASVARPDIMAWKYRKLIINAQNGIDAACRQGPEATQLIGLARAEAARVLAAAVRQLHLAEHQPGRKCRDRLPERRDRAARQTARGAHTGQRAGLAGHDRPRPRRRPSPQRRRRRTTPHPEGQPCTPTRRAGARSTLTPKCHTISFSGIVLQY